ncbi:hypothetical protein [Tenacibaculum ovolyticum]|uniref:hypothetical protein n=1 Tax=Tenacibaculum ovolyticum TaxID=104270 RepID=UPI000A9A9F8E|nr:hypothetical protein [Tenacibaculum ovolyticum]
MKTAFKVIALIFALGFVLFCMYKNNIVPENCKQQTQAIDKEDVTAPRRGSGNFNLTED